MDGILGIVGIGLGRMVGVQDGCLHCVGAAEVLEGLIVFEDGGPVMALF